MAVTLIMLKPMLPAWGPQEESEFKKSEKSFREVLCMYVCVLS